MINIGINGFGRIGRTLARLCADQTNKYNLVAVNDIVSDKENLIYLLKYDSTYGRFPQNIESTKSGFSINGAEVGLSSKKELENSLWKDRQVDVLIDSSGIESNVKKSHSLLNDIPELRVIVTHSSSDVCKEIIMGVNDEDITLKDRIFSASICDANACAHPLMWLSQEYGIDSGSLTTLHPWLSYQNLVDGASLSQSNPGFIWKDYSLGRASSSNLIPKNTTAVSATEKVLTNIAGKLMSFSYRIPTDIVSSSDMVIRLDKTPSVVELRDFLIHKINQSPYVSANFDHLVSVDYERNSSSAIVDMQWLKVQNDLVKIILWYDNEWGYSNRVLDLATSITTKDCAT